MDLLTVLSLGNVKEQVSLQEEKLSLQEERIKGLESELAKKKLNYEKVVVNGKEITQSTQLLAAHYLGIVDNMNITNEGKSQILQVLFRTKGNENLRKSLSNLPDFSKVKTKEELEFLLELFRQAGLVKEMDLVKADLKKIKTFN